MTGQPGYTLGTVELCQILDGVDEAALLIELPQKRIVAANARASNLTAWTRFDLTTMLLEQVVTWDPEAGPFFRQHGYDHKPFLLGVNNRSKKAIKAQGRTIPIHENLTLLLLDSAESFDHIQKRGEESNPILEKIQKLIRASKHPNPATALSRTLEIGSRMLEADALAIYLGNENIPSARRYTVWGKESIFPVEIFASDLNYLLEPTLWTRGQRSIITLLHQSARSSGLAYLVSCPIGQETAAIGVLAAGGFQMPASGDLLNLIKIIGAIITDVINQNALISNLQKQIKSQGTDLAALEAVKNTIRDGMVMIKQNLTILEINPAAELILGYASNEVKGLDVDSIFVGADRLIPSLNLALQGITTPNLGNIQLHRRDGSTFPADIGVVPIQTAGKTISALIMLRDESEHEQILVRTQQLEQRALLGEVTAVFAHEVRNPINNISTGLQLMADNLPEDEEQQELIARLQQDCNRLTDLMESVLTFSRTGGYTFLPVDIGSLVNRLVTRWTPRMVHLNIKSFISIPQGRHLINGDRRAIEQVFTNLISNAVQAMQETDGGTLAIKVSPYSGSSRRTMLRIDVSDTGPGIADENRQKIFDPFFTTRQNGTGLGLAITKQIITAHKGSISLTSFPGGTVFHVNIPAISNTEIPA